MLLLLGPGWTQVVVQCMRGGGMERNSGRSSAAAGRRRQAATQRQRRRPPTHLRWLPDDAKRAAQQLGRLLPPISRNYRRLEMPAPGRCVLQRDM